MHLQRRPPTTSLVALAGGLLFCFLLLRLSQGSTPLDGPGPINFLTQGRPLSGLLRDVFNSTLGFEKIYIINLPARSDHRDHMALAAAVSDLKVEFRDGVVGSTVLDKVLPPPASRQRMRDGEIGCWRAHMHILQHMVEQNISSALILEDDADWDIRIRSILYNFAQSSLALTQPLAHASSSFADATYPIPHSADQDTPDISFSHLPAVVPPKLSPYGDYWDLFWIGHCGMNFPSVRGPSPQNIPKGRVIQTADITVPEKQHVKDLKNGGDVKEHYPHHTRAVHHASEGLCSLGYAISQQGARRLLYQAGVLHLDEPYDLVLRRFCEGDDEIKAHNCLTSQPSLFKHHRPIGFETASSDITEHGDAFRDHAFTDVIRWSVKMNMDALLSGRTDFVDQWPDGQE